MARRHCAAESPVVERGLAEGGREHGHVDAERGDEPAVASPRFAGSVFARTVVPAGETGQTGVDLAADRVGVIEVDQELADEEGAMRAGAADERLMPASSRTLCRSWAWRVRSWMRTLRERARSPSSRMRAGGTKLAWTSRCWSNGAIPLQFFSLQFFS